MTILQMAREAFLAQDLLEEVEGLATDRLGLQVVGRLDEAGAVLVALGGIDEELDLDGAHRLERHRLHVLVGDDDVLVLGELVAADRVAAADVLVVVRAVGLELDPVEARLVQHVEAQPRLGLRGQVELDRDRDEPELDRPPPHRPCHASLPFLPRLTLPGAHTVRGRV